MRLYLKFFECKEKKKIGFTCFQKKKERGEKKKSASKKKQIFRENEPVVNWTMVFGTICCDDGLYCSWVACEFCI